MPLVGLNIWISVLLLDFCNHRLFPLLTAVLFHIPVFFALIFIRLHFPFPFFAWTPVVWRCNSLPLCVVRITTMARPLPPPHPPPRPPTPSFLAWTSMAWYAAPAITKPTTRLTATAPQRRKGPWPAGVAATWRRTACSSNVTTAGERMKTRPVWVLEHERFVTVLTLLQVIIRCVTKKVTDQDKRCWRHC